VGKKRITIENEMIQIIIEKNDIKKNKNIYTGEIEDNNNIADLCEHVYYYVSIMCGGRCGWMDGWGLIYLVGDEYYTESTCLTYFSF